MDFLALQAVVISQFVLQMTASQNAPITNHIEKDRCNLTSCKFTLRKESKSYLHRRIKDEDPRFIKFKIQLENYPYNATPDVFEPTSWVWTYNSSRGMYPYLSWNIDFGLLSFGLLEAKTMQERPFVLMKVAPRHPDEECHVTFGTRDTTNAIACALEDLMNSSKTENEKYQNNYFCFLAEKPGLRDSFLYKIALYTLYPVNYINYNCCTTHYGYTTGNWTHDCQSDQIEKWMQCTTLPYILGIVLLLYFPIIMLRVGEFLSQNLHVVPQEDELIGDESNHDNSSVHDEHWVFLSEHSPYGIFDLLSKLWLGLDKSRPFMVSRIKRFLLLVLAPTPVFVQMMLYKYHWEPGLIEKLVKHGTPMGFLTMWGDGEDRSRYFVPLLGGGMGILIAYGVLGIVIVVFPYNLMQIFEDGRASSSNTVNSPLCLGSWEIQDLSSIRKRSKPGYGYCADVTVSSIYLLFSGRFWVRTLQIQYHRFSSTLGSMCSTKVCLYISIFTLTPLYIVVCALELCLCLIWYGIPFCRLLNFLFRGVILSLSTLKRNSDERPARLSLFIRNRFVFAIIFVLLFTMSTFFTYTYCLIFIQSFQFIFQVLVFCFVAVIIYPAIAFGYLFFFVMLLYYLFHMVRGFGEVYLELLSEAVEISRHLDGEINYTTTFGSTLEVTNIKAHGITNIKIEGKSVCLPQDFFQSIASDTRRKPKVLMRNNTYGIPRKLFGCLIEKHKPKKKQFLKIVFQTILISLLLVVTMSITSGFITGPTSEISDVMHVLSIVVMGALPRMLEVAMSTTNESVTREIELRRLEQTIVRFWQKEEEEY